MPTPRPPGVNGVRGRSAAPARGSLAAREAPWFSEERLAHRCVQFLTFDTPRVGRRRANQKSEADVRLFCCGSVILSP